MIQLKILQFHGCDKVQYFVCRFFLKMFPPVLELMRVTKKTKQELERKKQELGASQDIPQLSYDDPVTASLISLYSLTDPPNFL
ncbi:hypothetical protein GE061_012171 [Apolygus lucorum]|uniref:Uncharacterized protein n=1 Tax=Apolygus lucorum TaxID=248454 RepID=A0A8S9XTT5_APOLU|nr:hypothetical protein GE061_012171 [Apolygus lucorum]